MINKKNQIKFFARIFILIIVVFYFIIFANNIFAAELTCVTKYPGDGQCYTTTDTLKECPENFFLDKKEGLCPTKELCCHQEAVPLNIKLQVPILGYTQATGIAEYIGKIYESALIIIVPITIIVIITAGVRWVVSAGNVSKIKEAKKYISNAFLGLFIALLGYVILSLVGLTSITQIDVQYIEGLENPIMADGATSEEYATFSKGHGCLARLHGAVIVGDSVNKKGKPIKTYSCPSIKTTSFSHPAIRTVSGKQSSYRISQAALEGFKKAFAAIPAGVTVINGGSFNCRGNVNSKKGSPSYHSYGIAFDVEPHKNQNCKISSKPTTCNVAGNKFRKSAACRGQNLELKTEIKSSRPITEVCTRAEEFGCTCNIPSSFITAMVKNGFRWGGAYTKTYDSMHFEWLGPCGK